jgi:hypothetical protein
MNIAKALGARKVTGKCKTCGHPFQSTIGELVKDPVIVCEGCRSSIRIDANNMRQGLETAQNDLDDFQRQTGLSVVSPRDDDA